MRHRVRIRYRNYTQRYRLRYLHLPRSLSQSVPARKMHQTTVRFGEDLWEALERECDRQGLSVAQFVREAALTRLAYAAAKRGDPEFEMALEFATSGREPARSVPTERSDVSGSGTAVARAQAGAEETSALWAQGRQARRRAEEVRTESARVRGSG